MPNVAIKGQTTQQAKDVILANNCVYVFVPKNLTNHFHPLDLNVNGQAKQFLKSKLESWYADQVTKEIEKGTNVYSVNIETKLSVVKPLHARWLISFYDHIQNNREMIIKAFQMEGITSIAEIEIPDEDLLKPLAYIQSKRYLTARLAFTLPGKTINIYAK